MLPQDLTTFLKGGPAKEQNDDPNPSTPLPLESPWSPPSKSPQHHPTYMGGALPKVPTRPSTAQSWSWSKGMPDPVNHPNWWILAEMDRGRVHPHWWKEIRASKRITMRSMTLRKCLNTPEALHYAQWQVVAFRLPLAQQEASSWWEAPLCLCGLCPRISCPTPMPLVLGIYRL